MGRRLIALPLLCLMPFYRRPFLRPALLAKVLLPRGYDLLLFPLRADLLIRPFQALEKRPEVRLLEYADVPGMTICPLLFYAQELAAKRFKKSKPSASAPGIGSNSAYSFRLTPTVLLVISSH
jgi:hypothetical protein